jgi:hypothetical protein
VKNSACCWEIRCIRRYSRSGSDNATGADDQQGSRTSDPSSDVLTLQRLHAELLDETLEGEVSVESNRMKIQSVPHGDMGDVTNKVAVPEGAAGSPPF